MTDPTRWRHADNCGLTEWWGPECVCGLSALRKAVASDDPLAALDVLGMGGTLMRAGNLGHCACGGTTHVDGCFWNLYRVVRPLPDTPEAR